MVNFVRYGPIISSSWDVQMSHTLDIRNLVFLIKSNSHHPIRGVHCTDVGQTYIFL